MKTILGNFLSQPNRDFPLDAETLDYLQSLSKMAAIIGNIAGDKVILIGCEKQGSDSRSAGYVFMRTKGAPEGEILYWEGGSTSSGMYLKTEAVKVTANNVEYPEAYTRRSLAPGIGGEHYDWADFIDIPTIKELRAENEKRQKEIADMRPIPIGSIHLWAGTTTPDDYLLCDGTAHKTTAYPELYAAIGSAFNSAPGENGNKYNTNAGEFRVPDLRGRFVVGISDSDEDYNKGNAGGLKTVSLITDQLPAHSHSLKDYYYAESDTSKISGTSNDLISTNNKVGSGSTDKNNDHLVYYQHETNEAGSGKSHENRPPYYALAYIIRAK